MKQSDLKKIEKIARGFFGNSSGCHDWTHVERVRNLALSIGEKEGADPRIVEAAALLHDIGRAEEMKRRGKGFCHAAQGAKMAEEMLKKLGIDPDLAWQVSHAVSTHRARKDVKPETLEAKVVFDADKLDSLGAVGWARIFLFAGNAGAKRLYTGQEEEIAKRKRDYSYTEHDTAFLEYEKKLKHLGKKMKTKTGKKMARERLGYMREYNKRFWQEVKGKL